MIHCFFVLVSLCCFSVAVIPLGEITTHKIEGTTTTIYAAPGRFGEPLKRESEAGFMKLVSPIGDPNGCNPEIKYLRPNQAFLLMVARGNCTFLDKTIAAANIGALGVVVYNSLEGIYKNNDYASSDDYECDNGSAYVFEVVTPVYSDEMNDLMPRSCTQDSKCASNRCLVTNTTSVELGTKVCCAWDLYTTMGATDIEIESAGGLPSIPSVFIRMEDADTLTDFSDDDLDLDVAMFRRPESMFDFASMLIWMIAVLTVVTGATLAAEEDKEHQQRGEYKKTKRRISQDQSDTGSPCPSIDSLEIENRAMDQGKGDENPAEGREKERPLGSGVIEDYNSFSPFKNLFTNAADASEVSCNSIPALASTISGTVLITINMSIIISIIIIIIATTVIID